MRCVIEDGAAPPEGPQTQRLRPLWPVMEVPDRGWSLGPPAAARGRGEDLKGTKRDPGRPSTAEGMTSADRPAHHRRANGPTLRSLGRGNVLPTSEVTSSLDSYRSAW